MRKSDIRKWVHGILDLLPLLVIPVFMVYSHRHTIDSYSVDVPQNLIVDFNQLLQNNHSPFINQDNWDHSSNVSSTISNGNIVITFAPSSSTSEFYVQSNIPRIDSHKYLYRCVYYSYQNSSDLYARTYVNNSSNANTLLNIGQNIFEKIITAGNSASDSNFGFICPNGTNTELKLAFSSANLFDLTQMFGVGNEPTIEQFDTWYPNSYYEYNLSRRELLKDYQTIVYDDTDIGSQFVYSLYNVTNNYFNFNNVFGFGNLQDWFLLNIFGGNAPLAFYIVWQVVLYEFLMDLIFLIYGLFMWFIDMLEKLMNKPLNAIK